MSYPLVLRKCDRCLVVKDEVPKMCPFAPWFGYLCRDCHLQWHVLLKLTISNKIEVLAKFLGDKL